MQILLTVMLQILLCMVWFMLGFKYGVHRCGKILKGLTHAKKTM